MLTLIIMGMNAPLSAGISYLVDADCRAHSSRVYDGSSLCRLLATACSTRLTVSQLSSHSKSRCWLAVCNADVKVKQTMPGQCWNACGQSPCFIGSTCGVGGRREAESAGCLHAGSGAGLHFCQLGGIAPAQLHREPQHSRQGLWRCTERAIQGAAALLTLRHDGNTHRWHAWPLLSAFSQGPAG